MTSSEVTTRILLHADLDRPFHQMLATRSSSGASLIAPSHKDHPSSESCEGQEPVNNLWSLIKQLQAILDGCAEKLDHAEIRRLQQLISTCVLDPRDWLPFAYLDHNQLYTRNLIDHLGGRGTLVLLVWTPGKESPIHDHADSHCIMKIVQGSLTESVYEWPTAQEQHAHNAGRTNQQELKLKSKVCYRENELTYIRDGLGLHQVSNPSNTEPAVSLHLYTPPYIASHGCRTFDRASGESSSLQKPTFYSEFGFKTRR